MISVLAENMMSKISRSKAKKTVVLTSPAEPDRGAFSPGEWRAYRFKDVRAAIRFPSDGMRDRERFCSEVDIAEPFRLYWLYRAIPISKIYSHQKKTNQDI